MLNRVYLVLLISFSFFATSSGQTDSLRQVFHLSIADSVKVKACHSLSQYFEKINTDSTLFWLGKGLSITKNAKENVPADAELIYYRGVFHTSIAMIYVKMSNDLPFAKAHIDSGIVIYNYVLKNSSNEILKAKTLQGLSIAYSLLGRVAYTQGDLNVAIQNYTSALEIQEKLNKGHGLAMMYNNLGLLHRQQAKYSQAIIYHEKALGYFKQINDSINIAKVMVDIAVVAQEMGVYDVSLHNFLEALEIFKRHQSKSYLASTYLNLGEIYTSTLNWPKAMKHYRLANGIFEESKDNQGIAKSFMHMGICFSNQNEDDSSLFYLGKAKLKYEEIGDRIGLSEVFHHLGEVYFNQKNYPTALKYFQRSEGLSKTIGLNQSLAKSKHSIAKVLFKKGRFDEAYNYAQSALEIANEFGLLEIKKNLHSTFSQILENQSNCKEALFHFKEYYKLSDSINSRERDQKFSDIETLYQLEQKQRIISQLEKEKALKEVELNKAKSKISWQRIHTYVNLTVLFLLTLVLLSLYRQYKLKQKSNKLLKLQYSEIHQKNEEIVSQKEEIENQRNELEYQKEIMKEKSDQLERFNWLITDSIDYASSIQAALMPSPSVFSSYFSDHFIMFFPKDVVSGDFYWAYPQQDTIFVVLSDCTGHGVPGGFMSMLGISALTELMVRGITNPADILDNLRLLVIESFKQTGKIGEHQDGMEVSIITYTRGNDYIDFAGANQPIWIIRKNIENNNYELIEQKGDRMPVSFHHRMRPFTSYRIPVLPDDKIYLFSDGFRDQLGGEKYAQKFGKENFHSLLLNNAHRSMDEQKSIIEDAFFRWVGGNDQLDDITILGLKI